MTAVAPDYHQLLIFYIEKMTHLVDGITNIIRFGDIPDVKSDIPVHQPEPLEYYTAGRTYVSKCL